MDSKAAFDHYEKRFAKAILEKPDLDPLKEEDKQTIKSIVKTCLGVRNDWIPQIEPQITKSIAKETYTIELLSFSSWEKVIGTALLFVPKERTFPRPFVLLCCGHGKNGKLNPGYQAMAARLARQGAMVLVPDNIGQGEREPMGHRDVIAPFACGISLQGLIVMETLAWLDWAEHDERIDSSKMAAIGNSGGGTLTLFLAALAEKLAVLSSSGYPSTFDFIAQKEKKHCHCNIIPDIVGQLEMPMIYGLFAPKPLFLFQGTQDHLFPEDLSYKTARQVMDIYKAANAEQNFKYQSFPGSHPWDTNRRFALSDFLAKTLDLEPAEDLGDDSVDSISINDKCLDSWPKDAFTADDIAKTLTGITPKDNLQLKDIYIPKPTISADAKTVIRSDDVTIFAQFEAFLKT